MQISSVLKQAGHSCEVIIDNNPIVELKKINPDLIAFSSMTIQHEWVSATAKKIREDGIRTPIIVGGPHPTFFPDILQDPNINMICRGEGEYTMLDVCNAIESNSSYEGIANINLNEVRPLINDLDSLPYSDREIYRKYKYFQNKPYEVFIGTRGCPFSCSFCFNHKMKTLYSGKGTYVRYRSPASLIDEIQETHAKYNIKQVMFLDSVFNLNKKWTIEFFDLYKSTIDIPFSCNVRADTLNEEIIEKIKSTDQCASLRFAIETGSERLRNNVLNKNISDESIYKATTLCKQYDIPIVLFSMFGLPTETLNDAQRTLNMIKTINPLVTSNYIFAPYPDLDITNLAICNGSLNPSDIKKLGISPYKMHRSILNQPDILKIDNLHKFSVLACRYPTLMLLINQLIKIRPNLVYDMIFNMSLVFEWKKWSKASYYRILMEALQNYKQLS